MTVTILRQILPDTAAPRRQATLKGPAARPLLVFEPVTPDLGTSQSLVSGYKPLAAALPSLTRALYTMLFANHCEVYHTCTC